MLVRLIILIFPYNSKDDIYVGDGSCLSISHIGNAKIKTKNSTLNLNKLLIVPSLKKNLLLVNQLTSDHAYSFEFSSNGFVIKDYTN